ncbi:Putative rmlC-like cupin domain superfamily, rmlC-like jelly roll protein [Septoria linicola]|uniref:RmlC-like cupin domain superfamily, rmlC-like jelly roll protein n=1 Tax=Septoria linicola TaxID=215465 RepID=A0A9Q9AKC1_9PEZI|nr:putative rmlC-like cupin domain superfamily, rmlC-like jelly roll protein [Septoria linicola]USW50615.1 Putative rmlC-like cupin domain superfamily, rmlC-like jelly roll protein [Septoria linicola]
MSNYITTHNAQGKAIFAEASAPHHKIPIQLGLDPEVASMTFLYTTESFPPNLSSESDIEQYSLHRSNGLPPGQICTPAGTSVGIATMAPGAEAPMHGTMTLDTIYILEGAVELHLEPGEVRTMTVGDSILQRGTMHKWKNVTPNNGKMRMMALVQPIVTPLRVGGKSLDTEWQT